jgi:hypothetical protein
MRQAPATAIAALLAAALLGPASAAEDAPAPPLPPERPEPAGPPPPPPEPQAAGVPVPPERPAEGPPAPAETAPGLAAPTPALAGEGDVPPLPPERPADLDAGQAALPDSPPPTTTEAEEEACRARLKELGAAFEPLPSISEGACGAPRPLRLTGLGGDVAVPSGPTVTCKVAEGLALWSRDVLVAAARAGWSKPLTAIQIGTSYQCRSQNHVAGAKLSEHAFANGVDVAGFVVGKDVTVGVTTQPAGSPEEAFQKAAREGACKSFTTVLGPGSDPSHATHLHLDQRERGKGYRICE